MLIRNQLSFLLLALIMGSSHIALAARAQAPVFDLSRDQDTAITQNLEVDQNDSAPYRSKTSHNHQGESIEQRVLRLEKQIANLTEMNYASKLEKNQQELQQLHGQLEVQNHDLSQLKEQVKNFYQDLDGRVSKLSPTHINKKERNTVGAENKIEDESTEPANNNNTKELQKYEAAFNLLNKKEYDKAINGFQTFVKDFPDSNYTANAHYWLGEIYYLKGKSENANKEFQIIISNYPDNAKVADAMLKVGLIAMDAGNNSKAKQNFTKVQKQFPGTTAAKIASLRLKELKQKG